MKMNMLRRMASLAAAVCFVPSLSLAQYYVAGGPQAMQQPMMHGPMQGPVMQGPVSYSDAYQGAVEESYHGDGSVVEGQTIYEGEGCDDCTHYCTSRFDVMFLTRDVTENIVFARRGPNGPRALTTDDLDFDEEMVSRIAILKPMADCRAIEGLYFGFETFEAGADATSPNFNLFSAYSDFGGGPSAGLDVDPSSRQSIDYESRLHNAEINFWHYTSPECAPCQVGFMFGARYLRIDESLNYFTRGTQNRTSVTEVETDNDMIGFQVGALYGRQLLATPLRVQLEAKTGVYGNNAEQNTETGAGVQNPSEVRVNDDNVAFVTDAGVMLTYDACCWLSLRAGYHVLYVDDIALASENFNPIVPSSPLYTPEIENEGNVFYHGAVAGLEIRW